MENVNTANTAYQQAPPFPGQQMPVVDASVSPGLAFLLGLIPGVGAIYNGQYAKGLIHAVIFGMLVSITDNHDLNGGFEALFGLMSAVWVFYMAFEAHHTAKRRLYGLPVDEFSSLVRINPGTNAFPIGPVILIGAGVFFLLANFNLIRLADFARFWPVLLIAAGAWLLYARMKSNENSNGGLR